jgi:serine/threonine-protein kinase RsbT
MPMPKTECMQIQSASDVVLVRQRVRQLAVELGFSLVEQTKVVTAASELARNTLDYGAGGVVHLQTMQEENRRGLLLCFEDEGPGIADVELALQDGYTTGNGLGLGLGGTKRLVNEFKINSQPGQGTRVTVIKWKA